MTEATTTTPATEAKPEVGAVTDWFKKFNVAQVDTIIALFEPPFETKEIGAALKAAGELYEKVEKFIDAVGLPKFAAHQAAVTVSNEELAAQMRQALAASATTADGQRPVVGVDGTVEMDPILVGLLVNAITRLAQMLLNRLGK